MMIENKTEIFEKQRSERKVLASGQQMKASDPTKSIWVEASAGTGKTKVLSDRVLRLLLSGVNPVRLLCLTYTKAAAVEMNTRISNRLSEWAVSENGKLQDDLQKLLGSDFDTDIKKKEEYQRRARTLFAVLLDTPGGLKIQTIHSFCEELLKRFPLEAGVSPYFEILDDHETGKILKRLQNSLLSEGYKNQQSPLGKAMHYLAENLREGSLYKLMETIKNSRLQITETLAKQGGLDKFFENMRKYLQINPEDSEESLKKAYMANLNLSELFLNMKAYTSGKKKDAARAEFLAEGLENGFGVNDYEIYRGMYLRDDGEILSERNLASKDAYKADEKLYDRLIHEAEKIREFERKLVYLRVYKSTLAVFTITAILNEKYEQYKQQKAVLDYDDLILTARRLLSDTGVASWVLFKLDGGIDHILLDEAQDTSPEQWDIIKYLSDEFFAGLGQSERIRTVFAVGDRKQSIFSFQGADPEKFDDMQDYFAEKIGSNFENVNLEVSFRSAPAVLETVNNLFALPEAAAGVVSDKNSVKHIPVRAGEFGKVEVWKPFIPENEEEKAEKEDTLLPPTEMKRKISVRTKLAKAIAGKIKQMIAETADSNRPLRFRDFMVLVRHRNDFVDDFIRACKEEGVNISGADKMVLSEQLAVQDLVSLAKFLLLTNDDLSLAEVLKSPLFGLKDEDLEELCYNRGGTFLWVKLGDNPKYRAVYEQLQTLLNKLDYIRPYELFNYVLVNMDGRRKFLARMGVEAEDALDEFLNLTLNYEQQNIPSLQNFINWFCQTEMTVKRESEEAETDAVRLMTVHHSKGLQARVVFLPDTMQPPACRRGQDFLADSEHAFFTLGKNYYTKDCEELKEALYKKELDEYRRLLYVALTRAEDRLIVCGYVNSANINADSWYKLCSDCFEKNGTETSEGWQYESPEIIAKEPKRENLKDAEFFEPEAWLEIPAPMENPTAKPYTPSKLLEDDEEPDSVSPLSEEGNFYRRGTLIHKLLQFLSVSTAEKEDVIEEFLNKNAGDFSVNQREQIKKEVTVLVENPEFKELFGEDSRSEVPIIGEVDGKIISAQVDKLLVLPEKVIIVDFKTNRPAAENQADTPEAYIKQLRAYKSLLRKIYPQKSIETYILWTNTAKLMKVS